jgi:quinol monooxygenase YgiN
MKEYVMIPFKVNEDKVDEAKKIISELISHVRENEPGVLLYKSLQAKNDPTTFIHFIIFKDNEAQMLHRRAGYLIQFVKDLYAICPADPHPVHLESFDSCGIAAEALDK